MAWLWWSERNKVAYIVYYVYPGIYIGISLMALTFSGSTSMPSSDVVLQKMWWHVELVQVQFHPNCARSSKQLMQPFIIFFYRHLKNLFFFIFYQDISCLLKFKLSLFIFVFYRLKWKQKINMKLLIWTKNIMLSIFW